jgi:hypothetical protein
MPDARLVLAVLPVSLLDRQQLFPLAGPRVFPLARQLEYRRTQVQARGLHRL